MRTGPYPNMALYGDATANDSDKTYTVPALREWRIESIYAKIETSADVGDRQLDVLLTDDNDNVIAKYVAGAVIAASLTREVLFAPGQPQETTFTGTLMLRNLADGLILPAGYKMRVYDSAAIAATADDLTVRIVVEEMRE